jgi:hypothetical protein
MELAHEYDGWHAFIVIVSSLVSQVTESRKPGHHPHADRWNPGGGEKDLLSLQWRATDLIIAAVAISNSAADQPTNETVKSDGGGSPLRMDQQPRRG